MTYLPPFPTFHPAKHIVGLPKISEHGLINLNLPTFSTHTYRWVTQDN